MKEIDLETWYRKDFYKFFTESERGRYSVTTPLDITSVYEFSHRNSISFYFALQHIFVTAIKSIEEFNIRIDNGKLFVTDGFLVASSNLVKGEKLYKNVCVPYQEDMIEFCKSAKELVESQKVFDTGRDINDIICLFSSLPWFETTMIENPKSTDIDGCIPIVIWDKIKDSDGKMTVNVTIEVNHRVIDGYLISRLLEKVNEIIKSL